MSLLPNALVNTKEGGGEPKGSIAAEDRQRKLPKKGGRLRRLPIQ